MEKYGISLIKVLLVVLTFCYSEIKEVFAQTSWETSTIYIRLGISRFKVNVNGPVLSSSQRRDVVNQGQEACELLALPKVSSIEYLSSDNEEVPDSLYLDFLVENNYSSYPKNRFWVIKVICEKQDIMLSEPLMELSTKRRSFI